MNLSVIIPVYNSEAYIERCIESIINQKGIDLEVICVDDGSTDNSLNVLRKYEEQFPFVHVYSQRNQYAGTARNTGLKYAKGDYIHFMDSDDYVEDGAYCSVGEYFVNKKYDFIKCRCKAFDCNDNSFINEEDIPYYTLEKDFSNIFGKEIQFYENASAFMNCSPAPWTGFYKREFLLKNNIKFNSLRCVNDRSFSIEVLLKAECIVVIDKWLVCHQVNNKSSLVGVRAENFECQFKSYELIERLTKSVESKCRKIILSAELMDLALTYKRINTDKYDSGLKEFFSQFEWENISQALLTDNIKMQKLYNAIGMSVHKVLNTPFSSVDEMISYLSDKERIVLYGAGRVNFAFIQFMAKHHIDLSKVVCIVVSDRKNNPDSVMGIPVCLPWDPDYKLVDGIVITTFESIQKDILNTLGFRTEVKIKTVSNWIYALIRQDVGDLEADIYQNTFWIMARQKENQENSIKEFRKVRAQLNRIEKCLQNQGMYYEKIITPDQYEQTLSEFFLERTGYYLNLKNPKTYNEKIQWIKLYGLSNEMTLLSDKYSVRDWVAEKIGEEYLTNLLGVWDSFSDIPFDRLPDRFVLKCNHGSGWNEIVRDKNNWNIEEAKIKFDQWMSTNYAFKGGLQLQYRDIVPKVIAEEYLENTEGDLYDYKFWCFGGKVEFVMFLSERVDGLKMNNYDRNWNLLPFTYNHPNSEKDIPRPKNLEKMIELAEVLAEGFRHVRVDFYQLNDGTIKFGEMTFTSCNGVCGWSNPEIDKKLGDLIVL